MLILAYFLKLQALRKQQTKARKKLQQQKNRKDRKKRISVSKLKKKREGKEARRNQKIRDLSNQERTVQSIYEIGWWKEEIKGESKEFKIQNQSIT